MKTFEVYQAGPNEVCLIVYDQQLASKVNKILKTYSCTFQEGEEPKFSMTNLRFDTLKAQVRPLKKAKIEVTQD